MSWVSKFKGSGKRTQPASDRATSKSKPASPLRVREPQPAGAAKPGNPPTGSESSLENELAQAMFRSLAVEQKTFANREEMAAGWRKMRGQYIRAARKTIRHLEKRGLKLSGPS